MKTLKIEVSVIENENENDNIIGVIRTNSDNEFCFIPNNFNNCVLNDVKLEIIHNLIKDLNENEYFV